jgi:hypothetical protein
MSIGRFENVQKLEHMHAGWERHMPSFLFSSTDSPPAPPDEPSSSPSHPSASNDSPSASIPSGSSASSAATSTPSTKPVTEGQKGQELPQQKLLRFGLIGLPNAGKSSLTNFLAGGTVTAVSVRPETTRMSALGAFIDGAAQVQATPAPTPAPAIIIIIIIIIIICSSYPSSYPSSCDYLRA